MIVGITPGIQQAVNALRAYRSALRQGETPAEALKTAKHQGSFSGPLRSNLIQLLDYLEVNRWLGIHSCESLFGEDVKRVHFTSALRYPVLVNGKNYAGRQPSMTRDPRLVAELMQWLPQELAQLENPLLVPLGDAVANALGFLAEKGLIDSQRVLSGLPHPSGANAERIAYFLGRKPRARLSTNVDPDNWIRREQARQTMQRLLQPHEPALRGA